MKWLGFLGLLVFVPNVQAAILYEQNFEEGKAIEERLLDQKDNKFKISCDNRHKRFSIQDEVKRHGKYSAYLTNGGNGETRCEWVSKKASGGHFDWDKEYWVGFSFSIPLVDKEAYNVYYQHHSQLSKAGIRDNCQYSGNGFTIRRRGKIDKNEMVVSLRPTSSLNVGGGSASSGAEDVYSWPLKLNEWNDFVLNFRYSDNNDGFFKVWHNGKLVVDQSGGSNVTLRDDRYSATHPTKKSTGSCGNPYLRLYSQSGGIYGGPNHGGAVYYDEMKIGDANSSYEEVSPAGGKSVSVPAGAQSFKNAPLIAPKGLELELN